MLLRSKDPMFDTFLNAELKRLRDSNAAMQAALASIPRGVPPHSLRPEHHEQIDLGYPTVKDGSLTTDKIKDDAVTGDKIGDRVITNDHIDGGGLVTGKTLSGPYNMGFEEYYYDKDANNYVARGWRMKSGGGVWGKDAKLDITGSHDNTGKVALVLQTSGSPIVESDLFPVRINDCLNIQMDWEQTVTTAGYTVTGSIAFYESDGTTAVSTTNFASTVADPDDEWDNAGSTVAVPTNACYARIQFTKAAQNFVAYIYRCKILPGVPRFVATFGSQGSLAAPNVYNRDITASTISVPAGMISTGSDYVEIPRGWSGAWRMTATTRFNNIADGSELKMFFFNAVGSVELDYVFFPVGAAKSSQIKITSDLVLVEYDQIKVRIYSDDAAYDVEAGTTFSGHWIGFT